LVMKWYCLQETNEGLHPMTLQNVTCCVEEEIRQKGEQQIATTTELKS